MIKSIFFFVLGAGAMLVALVLMDYITWQQAAKMPNELGALQP